MQHPPLRLALAAVAAILGFWLLSQLTVATWLARAASVRAQGWTQGVSPWQWDFSDPSSVVGPGSHGLDDARRGRDGLSLSVPQDGSVSLSLALGDEWIDLAAVDHVRIELQSDAPLRLILLSTQLHRVWLQASLERGTQHIELPLAELGGNRIDALQLRIEAQPQARVRLQQLALLNHACASTGDCLGRTESAPFFLTPEALLTFRDARRIQQPATSIVAGGTFGRIGHGFAVRSDAAAVALLVVMATGLSVLLVVGLRRRFRTLTPSRLRVGLELVATLGSAVVLLLAGWPARDTPVPIGLLLILCLAVLALTPAPTARTWHWLGDTRAWRSALQFTAFAGLLTAPLMLVDRGLVTARDPLSLLHYPAWALLQQWLLLAAIMPRLRVLLPDPRAAALAGGILFALLHAPNFTLMLFTFAGGSAWAWLGQRHRALLPLAASHVVLGWWLLYVAPIWILRSAEIGGRYLMTP